MKIMKIDFEISEADIKEAVERKVRLVISEQVNTWESEQYIRTKVRTLFKEKVDSVVSECLQDSYELREKIRSEAERKLRAQVSAEIKKATAQGRLTVGTDDEK